MQPAEPPLPACDPAIIAALVEVLGAARLATLIDALGAQIAMIDGGDRPALRRALHRLRGTAATLGLPRLAAALAAIDGETASAGEIRTALAALVALHAETAGLAQAAAGHAGATKR